MQVTVFYAWQSDTPEQCNRTLIRRAAEAACARITSDPDNDWEVRLDYDTKGVVGMCDIPREILKKIKDCDIFLADLTLVGASENGKKKLPNPNVVFELGYAAGRHTFRPMIGVVNEAFGEIEGQIFDIKRRASLKYTAKPTSSPDKIERVTDRLSQSIEAIIRDTIEFFVVDRRADREVSARATYEKRHAEFSTSMLNGGFYGQTELPTVLHSISFKWPNAEGFEAAVKAVKFLGARPEIHPGCIVWQEGVSKLEVQRDGVFRRASHIDVHASRIMAQQLGQTDEPKQLMADNLQRYLVGRIVEDIEFLTRLGVQPPLVVGTSLVGAAGFHFVDNNYNQSPRAIELNELNLPIVPIKSLDQVTKLEENAGLFREGFDWLCQHAGWEKSRAFLSNGTWKVRGFRSRRYADG
jgi:hypothetical protein